MGKEKKEKSVKPEYVQSPNVSSPSSSGGNRKHHKRHHATKEVEPSTAPATAAPSGENGSTFAFVNAEQVEQLLRCLGKLPPSKVMRNVNFDEIEIDGCRGAVVKEAFRKLRSACSKRATVQSDSELVRCNYKKVLNANAAQHSDFPKRPKTSYMIFWDKYRQKIKKKNPSFTAKEIVTVLGKKFRELPPEELEIYKVQAAEARRQHEREMVAYYERHPEAKGLAKEKRERRKKGGRIAAPKSAYDIFADENRQEYASSGYKSLQLRNALMQAFSELDEAERQEYMRRANAQMAEMLEYRKSHPVAVKKNSKPKSHGPASHSSENSDAVDSSSKAPPVPSTKSELKKTVATKTPATDNESSSAGKTKAHIPLPNESSVNSKKGDESTSNKIGSNKAHKKIENRPVSPPASKSSRKRDESSGTIGSGRADDKKKEQPNVATLRSPQQPAKQQISSSTISKKSGKRSLESNDSSSSSSSSDDSSDEAGKPKSKMAAAKNSTGVNNVSSASAVHQLSQSKPSSPRVKNSSSAIRASKPSSSDSDSDSSSDSDAKEKPKKLPPPQRASTPTPAKQPRVENRVSHGKK